MDRRETVKEAPGPGPSVGAMDHALLGRTGLYVSRLALGTMTFGGADAPLGRALGGLDDAATDRILSRALDAGVNLIDTADVYGAGDTERVLGRVLGARRDDVVLATKFSGRTGPGPNDVGGTRLHVMRALEASLTRLRTDHVDLYQLHSFDPITPIEETLRALDDAVRQGKVRYVGLSNVAAWQLTRAAGIAERDGLEQVASVQAYYSLTGREVERELVPAATAAGAGLLVWSPLAGGLLTGRGVRRATPGFPDFPPTAPDVAARAVDVARVVAERHDATVPQVALAWLLHQPAVTSVLVGARRLEQLDDDLGAIDLELTADDLALLDAVAPNERRYPEFVWDLNGDVRRPNSVGGAR